MGLSRPVAEVVSLAESYNGLSDVCKATGRAKQVKEASREPEAVGKQLAEEQASPAKQKDSTR
jgi:hypothetical protein